MNRPYDVVAISGYLLYSRWPHTVDYLHHLSIGLRFANEVETAVQGGDFHLTVFVDASR